MRNPKVLFVGHGRAGKDTSAEMFCEITGLRFAGTFSKYLIKFVAPKLGLSEEEAYARRHESDAMRTFWFETGNEVRKDDPALLAKMAFENGDVSGGVRGLPEIEAIRRDRVADLIVWVDRAVPTDPTLEFGPEFADVVLPNHGTIDELRERVSALASLFKIKEMK
jgi:hypothetical protein